MVPPACDAPTEGFGRFTEATAERGVVVDRPLPFLQPNQLLSSSVLAVDGDADGDIDLFFPQPRDLPVILANDGRGRFTPVERSPGPTFGEAAHGAVIALADVDGDRLPDLITAWESVFTFARNRGALVFDDPEVFHAVPPQEQAVVASLAVGDLDGDGDLDLVVPRNERLGSQENPPLGASDLVFLRAGGTWELAAELAPEAGVGLSLLAAITDVDDDGDGDVLVPSDLGIAGRPPTALYPNDGAPSGWRDAAREYGVDLAMSAMGIDTADLNGDGRLDACITDIGRPKCLLSSGDGFVEGGLALGLTEPDLGGLQTWSGWSMDLADLDHDGLLDLAAVGAPPGGPVLAEYGDQPTVLWRGEAEGFVQDDAGLKFPPDDYRWGMATADLDGDGWLELVLAGREQAPRVFWNACGEAAWLEVELRGPAANSQAFGARVEVRSEGHRQVRELHGLRSQGQGPRRLHFGLGDADLVDATIRWPDGTTTELSDVPTRRRIVVPHPG